MDVFVVLLNLRAVFCGKRRPDNNKEDVDEDDEDMLCCEICWESEHDLFSLRSCPPNGECSKNTASIVYARAYKIHTYILTYMQGCFAMSVLWKSC